MATAIVLKMDPALNPLPRQFYVRITVLRADGGEFTTEEIEQVYAAFPQKPARAKKPAAKRRATATSKPAATPKRAAARRPAR
jgi:hypothetical protein